MGHLVKNTLVFPAGLGGDVPFRPHEGPPVVASVADTISRGARSGAEQLHREHPPPEKNVAERKRFWSMHGHTVKDVIDNGLAT